MKLNVSGEPSLTMLRIARADAQWLSRLAALMIENSPQGVLLRAWADPDQWLAKSSTGQLTKEEIDLLADAGRKLPAEVIMRTVSTDLTHVYVTVSPRELTAFFDAARYYDDLPLAVLPAGCSDSVIAKVLETVDRYSYREYLSLADDVHWLATVNTESADDEVVCIVSRDRSFTDELRSNFTADIIH